MVTGWKPEHASQQESNMERMGISRLKADELIVSMFGTCGLSPSKEMQAARPVSGLWKLLER